MKFKEKSFLPKVTKRRHDIWSEDKWSEPTSGQIRQLVRKKATSGQIGLNCKNKTTGGQKKTTSGQNVGKVEFEH